MFECLRGACRGGRDESGVCVVAVVECVVVVVEVVGHNKIREVPFLVVVA